MLLSLTNVTFGYIGVPILEDVNFTLNEGDRVGFIGGNGEGKTTLLRLMTGELSPDGGTVFLKSGLRLGYLAQSGGLESKHTVYDAMEEVFEEDKRLLSRLNAAETALASADESHLKALSAEIESLNRRIAARDSYHYEVKIRTVLNGMGFQKRYEQIVSTMSGGEKTKLKLCRLLLEEPELLLLDEPTNHLDVKTLFWLEDFLSTYKNALMIVSHDRYFLDKLTTKTLELECKKVNYYRGNYSKYKELKAIERLNKTREYEKQQEERAKLTDYINRNLVRATTAKSALSRVNQLERMELKEAPPPPPKPPRFHFTYEEKPCERVLYAPRFTLCAGEKTLLQNIEFTLMRGDKCALVGENGAGKSTLLKYLLRGPRVQRGRFVKIAYYDQENEGLNPAERVLDAFWGRHSLLTQTEARKLLANCGLLAEETEKTCGELSGGQRAKLKLALLSAEHGNVLLLDEPTNHLDLAAREALEEALRAFDGTLLFVSHDRRFIEAVATSFALIENRTLTAHAGSYTSYCEAQTEEKPQKAAQKPEKKEVQSYRTKEERSLEAKRKARSREIEKRIDEIAAEEERLNNELTECGADYLRANEISMRLQALSEETETLYEEYLIPAD